MRSEMVRTTGRPPRARTIALRSTPSTSSSRRASPAGDASSAASSAASRSASPSTRDRPRCPLESAGFSTAGVPISARASRASPRSRTAAKRGCGTPAARERGTHRRLARHAVRDVGADRRKAEALADGGDHRHRPLGCDRQHARDADDADPLRRPRRRPRSPPARPRPARRPADCDRPRRRGHRARAPGRSRDADAARRRETGPLPRRRCYPPFFAGRPSVLSPVERSSPGAHSRVRLKSDTRLVAEQVARPRTAAAAARSRGLKSAHERSERQPQPMHEVSWSRNASSCAIRSSTSCAPRTRQALPVALGRACVLAAARRAPLGSARARCRPCVQPGSAPRGAASVSRSGAGCRPCAARR